MIASNREWKRWGKLDAFFGVASWKGRERGAADAWTPEEFYRLGESDWLDFRRRWESYGVDRDSCVEIGCGAGRITKQLASEFRQVYGVDVSSDMIDCAKEHITADNIEFHCTAGAELPLGAASVTAAFSCHVFQHFESTAIAGLYFRELARVLRPGGSLMIHLPIISMPPSRTFRLLKRVRELSGDVKVSLQRALMMANLGKPPMRGLMYEIDELFGMLEGQGFGGIELSVLRVASNASAHPFVLARRQ